MSDVILRAASRADAPALADLARRSFAATYAPTHDAERIRIHCETVLSDPAVAAWFEAPEARIAVAAGTSGLLGYVQWQPADAPIPALLDALRRPRGAGWQPAPAYLAPEPEELAGERALVPQRQIDWKNLLLWALLVGGAVLVAALGLSLLRQPPRD